MNNTKYNALYKLLRWNSIPLFLFSLGLINTFALAAPPTKHAPAAANNDLATTCAGPQALPSPDCGTTPSPAFSADGRLWLVFEQHGHIYVTVSDDPGKHFAPPVAVNRTPELVYTNGENRPKIAIGPQGGVFVSWTRKIPGRYAGDVRFARSTDAGKHFSDPVTVNSDHAPISHRFDTLAVNRKGEIFLVWLDKRDRAATKAAGGDYTGAALYYAVSKDGGAHFSANRKIVDHTCECCRIALSVGKDGRVTALWRHIFGHNTRDHALVTLDTEAPVSAVQRVSFDDWQTDSCPHHGPDIDQDDEGRLHMTWFTLGPRHRGLRYGRFDPRQNRLEFEQSLDSAAGASHPQILKAGNRIYTAWKRFQDNNTLLQISVSPDEGRSWSAARTLAETQDASDHPILLRYKNRVFVSWHSLQEGYRLLGVDF